MNLLVSFTVYRIQSHSTQWSPDIKVFDSYPLWIYYTHALCTIHLQELEQTIQCEFAEKIINPGAMNLLVLIYKRNSSFKLCINIFTRYVLG